MRRALRLLILLLCFAPAAQAERVQGLYEAEVAVPDQSNSARVQGVVNALRSVIIKLTGDRGVLEKAEVGLILRAAERYLLQYRYQEVAPMVDLPQAPVAKELRLWAQFSQPALDQDLRGAGLSIWGAERPSTLVWIAINEGDGWFWVGGDRSDGTAQAQIEASARGRGLGVNFPLHDLEDDVLGAAAIGASDIAAISQASARYHSDAVLAVAMDHSAPGSLRTDWTLLLGSETEQWSTAADEPVSAGVDALADRLALRYASAGAGAEQGVVTLSVVGVNSASGYARALHYLQAMNSVTAVQVTQVAGDTVTYALSAYGGADALRQAITLGRVLEPVSGPDNTWRLRP